MSGYVAALVLGGVLAAVAGDWLGHRLGRRRVVLFRLRPRHSGLLGTGVAGAAVGLVAGLGLWGAGAFGGPPEPVFIKVPVPRLPAWVAALPSPSSSPAPVAKAATPPVVPAAPKAAPTPDAAVMARLRRAERRVQELETAMASRPAPEAVSPLPPVLVARRGEALCFVEIAGGRSSTVADNAINQVLALVERYGVRRGAAAELQVPAGQLEEASRTLQAAGAYRLQVIAARHVQPGEPLAVQLAVLPMPVESLADLQERARLEGGSARAMTAYEHALGSVAAGDRVAEVPNSSYVTLPESAADSGLKLVWREDPAAGGPIRLLVGTATR